ncbi:LacI family DNA-binding transcriptional regulator [Vibrio barjaei]|uniref:LacI family DNA-binding transcriptional regulator n=1 Tax=Vibrio barjaei TaxID=1676683 RepID=A0ABW7IJ92_9VIBR
MSTKTLPTLQDVADRAGVSKAVASRAFSKEKKPISEVKKQRVLQAAEELGYVMNPFAQSLNSNTTGLVAIVVNHISDLSDLELFDHLLRGLQSIGKLPIFIRIKTEQDIASITDNAFVHRVDAAIIFSDLIEPKDMPKLFLTPRVINLNGQNWDNTWSVLLDEEQAIQDAVNYAVQSGVKEVHLLAGRQSSAVEERRLALYQDNLECHDISLKNIAYCNYKYNEAKQYLIGNSNDIVQPNSGVICTSDAMAMAAVDSFGNQDDRPVIIGFDNTFFSHFGSYQFPSIGYSKEELIDIVLALISLSSDKENLSGEKYIRNFFNCH